jgi:hypothetical protein
VGERVNGSYHAMVRPRGLRNQTRIVIGIGAFVSVLAALNIFLVNNDMTRIEQSGPPQLALAGGGLGRFLPSLLTNLSRANAPAATVNAPSPNDPRRSPGYIADKRALERWMALGFVGLSALFIGLQQTAPPDTRAVQRSPIGADLARLLVLLALAYGSLSFFENG